MKDNVFELTDSVIINNNKYREFFSIIKDLTNEDTVQQMRNFRQHYDTTCYSHCLQVAYISYLICRKLGLDYKAAARSGLLHDLFLYDWRVKDIERKPLHGFHHPKTALTNSLKIVDLSIKEQDIILKHMWPLTIKLPKYKESYIVCLVDKYCALYESFKHYRENKGFKKAYRYSYIFFGLLIFKLI